MKSIFKTFLLSLMMIANIHFAYAQSGTASILPNAKTVFLDSNGKPLVSGKVNFYIPGTTTRKTTWQDSGETIPNSNPVILDSAGRALILGDGSYRQQVFDRNNNLIWDANTSSTGSGGGGTTATVGDGDLVGTIKPWGGLLAPNQYSFSYGQEFARASFPLLFATLTSQQNASCTSGTPALTGLGDTSNIPIGAPIESACLSAGATVISKTVSTVGTSSNAIITTTTSARFFPFGNGDGSTTFNVPDLRGRVIAGRDNMGGIAASRLTTSANGCGVNADASGAVCGNESYTTTLAQLPTGITSAPGTPWTVTQTVGGGNNVPQTSGNVTVANATSGGTLVVPNSTASNYGNAAFTATGSVTSNNTGATAHPSIQPTETLNYIIKTLPDTNANTFFGVASIGGMQGVLLCGFGITCAGNIISAIASTVPPPTLTTLGGVFSDTCSSHNWFNILDTTGTFGCSQPNFTDLASSIALAQIPNSLITYAKIQNGTGLSLLGVAGNAGAANADIIAASANQVMRSNSAGTSIGFGSIDLSQTNTVGASLLSLINGGCNAALTANNGGILWSNATQCQILAGTATARLPLLSGSTAAPVWGAFTLPASVTSGGILCFTSTTVSASSVLETANAIMLGGGAGACPAPLASLGTTTTVLHGNAGGAPTYAAIVSADMNITASNCTNQFVSAISTGGVGTCSTVTLASAQFANQGTTTTVLHGNGAGNPSFGAVNQTTDITGATPIANGGSSQTTVLAARGASGFNLEEATSTGDTNGTIVSTDRSYFHTALTAARTDTLPAANALNPWQLLGIWDPRGVASATNTITLARAGADTINGGTTYTALNGAFGITLCFSDGVSRWKCQQVAGGGGGGGVTGVTISAGTGIGVSGTCNITSSGTCTVALSTARQTLPTVCAGFAGGTCPTSGTGATYTTPANVLWLEVFYCGGGGGGNGVSSTANVFVAGSDGSATAFNSVNANPGKGATGTTIATIAHGAGGISGTGTATDRIPGGPGSGAGYSSAVISIYGGSTGGGAAYGGGGSLAATIATSNGTNGAANSCEGGSSASNVSTNNQIGASGGGGESVYLVINSPSATYTYTIGPGGSGGSSTSTGGNGGSGKMRTIEHYGT